ncbi:hypothetical protein TSUD_422210, partial [Trifolium subterraneum]
EGLWYRVLAARYGVETGRLCAGGMRGSFWWREFVRIRDGGDESGGGWFGGHISKKVGDGEQIGFSGRDVLVRVGGGAGGEAHSLDRWLWQPDLADGYTVCGAYQLLTDQDMTLLDAAAGLI